MLRADVLIVTAVPEEHQAVLEADGGAGAWTEHEDPMGISVAFREIALEGGGSLTIAVTQALGMGGPNAVIAAANAIKDYDVRCLAMCGVCAGRRGDVALGDVIVADRVWQYGAGKRKAEKVRLGQHEAALASAQAALDAIWPFFRRLPAAFERSTGKMLATLRFRLEALGRPLPPSLLDREATFAALRNSGAPTPE